MMTAASMRVIEERKVNKSYDRLDTMSTTTGRLAFGRTRYAIDKTQYDIDEQGWGQLLHAVVV